MLRMENCRVHSWPRLARGDCAKAVETFAAQDPDWSTYDEATRTEQTRVFELDCFNHLRKNWFEHGGKAVVAHWHVANDARPEEYVPLGVRRLR